MTHNSKQLARKNHLILCAMKAWSRKNFGSLTMDAAAIEASVSKAALYRYFSSKEDLVNSIESLSIDRLSSACSKWIALYNSNSETESIQALTELSDIAFELFNENPYYIHYITARSAFLSKKSKEILESNACQLIGVLCQWYSAEQAIWFIFTSSFWNQVHFATYELEELKGVSTNKNWILQRCLYGLSGQRAKKKIRYQAVERAFLPAKSEAKREPHRLFSAIEAVITELGIADATAQRIADRIGISVSSLYFHFSSHSDMLQKMLIEEQNAFLAMLTPRMQNFSGTIEEKLYGLYILLDAYFLYNPQIITVGNWLQTQTISLEYLESVETPMQVFEFIEDGIESSILAAGLTAKAVLAYLRIYVGYKHFACQEKLSAASYDNETLMHLRQEFLPVLTGMQNPAWNKEKKGAHSA